MSKLRGTRDTPIGKLSAEEIIKEFVEDGVRQTPTPLPRFTQGMERAARLRLCSQEQVYQDVRAEVKALTGHGLPVG